MTLEPAPTIAQITRTSGPELPLLLRRFRSMGAEQAVSTIPQGSWMSTVWGVTNGCPRQLMASGMADAMGMTMPDDMCDFDMAMWPNWDEMTSSREGREQFGSLLTSSSSKVR